MMGQNAVRNITDPTITPFLPDPAKATGVAVIILPGGGFQMLSIDGEGWAVAKWLAARGVAAFVLKYRLNETPRDDAQMQRTMMKMFAAIGSGTIERVLSEPRATDDAIAAMRTVRSGASRWKVDPARIGLLGFSAGAMTAMLASTAAGADRPAFLGYIYGPMGARDVPADVPPMFAALAIDDPLFGGKGFGIVDSWNKVRRPVELHAYEKGGHGFGMGRPGTTTTLLMEEFYAWLTARRLLAGN
ncbi:MAG TPA: alpha/beta hydrolase [Sphingobium sp.]|uniref:alpha/beta hydrolase n=1 Tax=Sphingobium sp. TaxID=1912891 RepID=UPI002ED5C032